MDDIEPGDGFYDDQDANKGLNGRLFLMMTDQRALEELQSLFDSWKCTPQTSFSSGLAPLKKVFENLREVRPWDVRDRLVDTGLLKDWEQRKQFGQTTVSFEAELWYRDDPSRRQKAARQIRDLVRELGGHIVTECVIQDIAYRAMLGQIDISYPSENPYHCGFESPVHTIFATNRSAKKPDYRTDTIYPMFKSYSIDQKLV